MAVTVAYRVDTWRTRPPSARTAEAAESVDPLARTSTSTVESVGSMMLPGPSSATDSAFACSASDAACSAGCDSAYSREDSRDDLGGFPGLFTAVTTVGTPRHIASAGAPAVAADGMATTIPAVSPSPTTNVIPRRMSPPTPSTAPPGECTGRARDPRPRGSRLFR